MDWLRIRPCLVAGFVAAVLGCSAGPGVRAAADPSFPGSLHGVAAASSTDAWAVGFTSPPGGRNYTLILHWNGTAWSRVASPSPGASSELLGVSATAPASAWAVGQYCTFACGTSSATWNALIMHWNGTAWSRVASPGPNATMGTLFSVSATSSTNAWAVGAASTSPQDLIVHWNGTTWFRVAGPSPGPHAGLLAVTATSATNAWAVGDYSTPAGQPRTLILHWNGTNWSRA